MHNQEDARRRRHTRISKRTLYQRLLGAEFEALPPVLRRFHSLPDGGRAAGSVVVHNGKGLLRHSAARLLKMPRAGTDVPVQLQVVPQGDSEVWIRHFGSQCIVTRQWQAGDFLVEQAGPLQFVFRVSATQKGLLFAFQYNSLCGVRLPTHTSLGVAATATGRPDHWNIHVTMQAPLLGAVTTYSGDIYPLW
jgi:hypothetical protein